MTREEFEKLIAEEFPRAVPQRFHHLLKNIAFLADDEPDQATRAQEGLVGEETLLGLYRGIPHTERGAHYGHGMTLPDTITLYQKPIEEEAADILQQKQYPNKLENVGVLYEECVRTVVRETIWHEVAHAFGYDEDQVRGREDTRENGTL